MRYSARPTPIAAALMCRTDAARSALRRSPIAVFTRMLRVDARPRVTRLGSLAVAASLFPTLFVAGPVAAQAGPTASDSRAELLVDADWLMANREMDDLVIVHVAGDEEGAATARTIPGASVIHLGQISVSRMEEGAPRVRLDLPDDLKPVVSAFERAGISDGSRVVLVSDGGQLPRASRALWTLQFLGLDEDVSILDGGVDAWVAAGGAVTTERAAPARGAITAALRADRRVDAGWVLTNGRTDGVALIDARRTVSYDGTRPELPGRIGHIPGAGSLPQVELYTEGGRLKSDADLRALFERAGVTEGDQVVAYCHIGLWASAVVFAARTLGIDARLYDGSMTEWAADPELPLVVPGGGR